MVMFSTLLMSVALFAGAVGAKKTTTNVPTGARLSISCPEGSTCCLKGDFTNFVNDGIMNLDFNPNDCAQSLSSGSASATCGSDADCSIECGQDCGHSMVSGNPPSTSVDDTACADFATLSVSEHACTTVHKCKGLEDTNFGSDCDGNREEHK